MLQFQNGTGRQRRQECLCLSLVDIGWLLKFKSPSHAFYGLFSRSEEEWMLHLLVKLITHNSQISIRFGFACFFNLVLIGNLDLEGSNQENLKVLCGFKETFIQVIWTTSMVYNHKPLGVAKRLTMTTWKKVCLLSKVSSWFTRAFIDTRGQILNSQLENWNLYEWILLLCGSFQRCCSPNNQILLRISQANSSLSTVSWGIKREPNFDRYMDGWMDGRKGIMLNRAVIDWNPFVNRL